MNNERIYQIRINGVSESVDIIDKLLKKLDALEERINALKGKTVSVGTSGGGSKSTLSADEKLYKEILKTEQKIAEASEEDYQILLKKKAELKEIQKEQKSIVAGQRAEAQEYANTLNGQRQRLADMKAALANMTIGSEGFNKQIQEIDQLNEKIKNIEQSYGVFGRNVGNYANGVAEGMQKVVIKVGETERTFNSAKEASKTLGNELKSMAVNGEQGTKAYQDLDEAFKKLQSTMKDVSASSKSMDILLDTMKGFTALGSVGNGLSSIFGFDGGQIQQSIQKLVALQNVMQGIEVIQKQMTTEEGIGAIFKDASDSIDVLVAKLPGVKLGIEGLETSSKSASVAVKGLSTALKALTGLGLAYAITKAIDQLKDIGNEVKTTWNEIFPEKFTAEEQLANAIEATNTKLQNRLQLINEDQSLSKWGKQTQTINEVNKALQEQLDLYISLNQEGTSFWENMQRYGGQAVDDILGGKGLMKTLGSMGKDFAKWIQDSKSARKSNEELEASVASLSGSVKQTSSAIESDAAEMVQRWAKNINQCDIKTEEGKKKFKELAKALDDDSVLNSVLLNLHRYFRNPETIAAIQAIIANVRQLRGELSLSPTSLMGNVSGFAKTSINWMNDFIENAKRKQNEGVKSASKAVGQTVQEQEMEITRLKIKAMDEGLQKTIAEINLNTQKEISQLKLTGIRKQQAEQLIEEERQRKIREAQAKDYQARIEIMRKFQREISRLEAENLNQELENLKQTYQNFADSIKIAPLTMPGANFENDIVKNFTTNLQWVQKEQQEETLKEREEYYSHVKEVEIEWYNTLYEERKKQIQKMAELEKDELEDEIASQFGSLDIVGNVLLFSEDDISKAKEIAKNYGGELGKAFSEGKISLQEYQEIYDEFVENYIKKSKLIEQKEADLLQNAVNENVKNQSKVLRTETENMVKDIEDIISGIDSRYSNSSVRDAFGIIDLGKSRRLTKETVQQYEDMSWKILDQKVKLDESFQNGTLTFEDYREEMEKVILIYDKLQDKIKETEAKQADFSDFLGSIMPYVNQITSGISQILSQVSSLVSAEFEAQRQVLEDELTLLEEKYQAQEELEQQHADKLNSIEQEIADARGARRDHLVDMYNEEIAAQRRAFIEKQKIDAEMRRKEEQEKALEKQERKRQNQIQFQQTLISQAATIMNAFATKPFIPVGLAMGALATALTAAQIVLMKKAINASEKYAKGGVIQGKSHKSGGVKILGGRAEVEGGEFITNKKTTAMNTELLTYINSQNKRITPSDLNEFFNGNASKRIKNNFKTKFANGGQLPATNIRKTDNTIVVVDKSQPVVQVVDILDATKKYENVRVLAGVE